MRFRCPYCGEEVFSLRTKLGITTRFGTAPRCSACKRVVFRHFVVGGYVAYHVCSCLIAVLFAVVVFGFGLRQWHAGVVLSAVLFLLTFLAFNYYGCYFDKAPLNKEVGGKTIRMQVENTTRLWPNIRKGEIYELFPAEESVIRNENTPTIAMAETVERGCVTLRIIQNPQGDKADFTGALVLSANGVRYFGRGI